MPHDIVCLNAGAALYAAERGRRSIDDGIELARATIASGAAHAKMQAFVAATADWPGRHRGAGVRDARRTSSRQAAWRISDAPIPTERDAMTDILNRILARKAEEVAERQQPSCRWPS